MPVLRILQVTNGWILNPGEIGGDILTMDDPERMRVASTIDQLVEEVRIWGTYAVTVCMTDVEDDTDRAARYERAEARFKIDGEETVRGDRVILETNDGLAGCYGNEEDEEEEERQSFNVPLDETLEEH